ncbi:MAG: YgaP family membrane protein [Actinomycetota bacterium]
MFTADSPQPTVEVPGQLDLPFVQLEGLGPDASAGTRFLYVMSGPVGRAIRSVAGAGIIAGGLATDRPLLAAFGVLPLATGVLDLCPINLLRRLPVGGRAFRDASCRR